MRKTKTVVIEDDPNNRDSGKIFVLKEMPAAQAERWATRALQALARSNLDVPANIGQGGWAGIAVLGFTMLAHASFDELKPLLDEMWACVQLQPDARNQLTRVLYWGGADGEGADIEEVATMMRLRKEVFELHMGFSIDGDLSNSLNRPTTSSTPAASPSTSTSTRHTGGRLGRSSHPGRQPSKN